MLKLKLQYFDHLIRGTDSLEKMLMLGKIEGGRRRGRQRMRWLDSIMCPTHCDPMDYSTPGFPVHHQLPKLAQTHVHRVGDAIQPSHPLSSSLLLPSIFPSIRVFSNGSTLHIRWPKYWRFSPSNEYSGLISFRLDWFDLLAV